VPVVWRRHPADVARLVVAVAVLGVLLLVAEVAPEVVRDVSADLARSVRRIPRGVRQVLVGLTQTLAVLVPFVVGGVLVTRRRLRLLGVALASAVTAGLLMAALQGWLDRTVPPAVLALERTRGWLTGGAFPSATYLAAFTAGVVVLGAAADRSWRRAGWLAVAVLAVLRLGSAATVPVNLGTTIALGAAVASLALVAFGSPRRRVRTADVMVALGTLGVETATVEEVEVGAGHSRTFRAVPADGAGAVFVKLIGRDERNAELLMRAVRALRLRGMPDEQRAWAPLALARQEALAGLLAARAGARTAEVLAAGETATEDGLVVLAEVHGRRLSGLTDAEIDDALLDAVYAEAAALAKARIAHRWLDAAHVVVGDDGPVLLDFRWSVLGAPERLLAVDVANLTVSLAALVGAERAVTAAARTLDPALLAAAVPLTQRPVLSPTTQAAVRERPGLVEEVRDRLARAAGIEEYTLVELQRLTPGRVVSWVGTAVFAYFILAFVSNLGQIRAAFAEASFGWLPVLLLLPLLGSVAGAASLMGATTAPLPLGLTSVVMQAQSFLNRFTPANAGGMAMRVRYLQRRGEDLDIAAASVGLTSLASGVVQAVLLAALSLWVGSSEASVLRLPDVSTLAVGLLVLLGLGGLVAVIPAGRRLLGRVVPTLRKVRDELTALARSPGKLALLFGGALGTRLTTIVTFILACRSFGVTESAATLALLLLTATTVASAAPTPGGVGAVEAALVAVLTGTGLEASDALAVAVFFRVIDYWYPVLPSWVALQFTQRWKVV
jgi:undecaprenyl-diphosphatase